VWNYTAIGQIQRKIIEADVVVVSGYNTLAAIVVMAFAIFYRKRRAFWGERFFPRRQTLVRRLRRTYKLAFLAPFHRIVCIGRAAASDYQNLLGSSTSISIFPYHSRLQRFQALPIIDTRQIRILFMGEFCERKGVDALLSLIVDNIEWIRRNGLSFTFAGSGELEAEVKETATLYGDCVSFVGFVPWNTTHEAYGDADIVIAPSRHDGWCIVVVEAMAAGRIVITTPYVGSAIDLVEHQINGFIIKEVDSRALRTCIQAVLDTPLSDLRKVKERARRSVEELDVRPGARRFTRIVGSL